MTFFCHPDCPTVQGWIDEETGEIQEYEPEDPWCTCCAEHSIEELDFNWCDSCGKEIVP